MENCRARRKANKIRIQIYGIMITALLTSFALGFALGYLIKKIIEDFKKVDLSGEEDCH